MNTHLSRIRRGALQVFGLVAILGMFTETASAAQTQLGVFTLNDAPGKQMVTVIQHPTSKETVRAFWDSRPLETLKNASIFVSQKVLDQIPTAASKSVGSMAIRRQYAGKLIKRLGDGRVWFVQPENLKRYYYDGTPESRDYFLKYVLRKPLVNKQAVPSELFGVWKGSGVQAALSLEITTGRRLSLRMNTGNGTSPLLEGGFVYNPTLKTLIITQDSGNGADRYWPITNLTKDRLCFVEGSDETCLIR